VHFSNPFDDRAEAHQAKTAALLVCLLLANLATWVAAALAFAGSSILFGTAVLAYTLGLRHAFDVDHIAAIDNVVRKLVQDGKRPLSTGFFFALGHSTVVVLASLAVAATAAAMPESVAQFHSVSGPIGTIVSATFLIVIGIANLIVLRALWRRGESAPETGAASLDKVLDGRGFFARLLGPLLRSVSRSWHLYPIGFLFGLGFDTAAEIGLLGISATQVAGGLSVWQIVMLPALFTAGMTFFDTLDSVLMTGTYGWAFVHPERKRWYNLVITATSVAVAVSIGGIELAGLFMDQRDLAGSISRAVGSLAGERTNMGAAIVAVLAATSFVSFAIFRRRRYENLPRSPG
jgi:high-affinity nickel-transport protein